MIYLSFGGFFNYYPVVFRFVLYSGVFSIEVQITNPNRELYERHHDWVMRAYNKPSWVASVF